MICDDAINNWNNAMPQRTKTKQNRGNENKRIQVEIQHHCHQKNGNEIMIEKFQNLQNASIRYKPFILKKMKINEKAHEIVVVLLF